jgi:hypothetical protein
LRSNPLCCGWIHGVGEGRSFCTPSPVKGTKATPPSS